MELHIADRDEANDIQERVLQIYREQVIARLTAFCDAFIPADERISLDKMEIDLGIIKENDLKEKLPGLLQEKFELQLKEKLLRRTLNPEKPSSKSHGDGARKDMATRTRVELLMYYLKYGSLPWWNPHDETDIELLINQQMSDDDDLLWTAMEKHVHKPALRKRLIHHLSDDQLDAWLARKSSADVLQLYEIFQKLIITDESLNISNKNLRQAFFDGFLRYLGGDDSFGINGLKLTKEQNQSAVIHILRRLSKALCDPEYFSPKLRQKITSASSLFKAEEWKQIFKKVDVHPESEKEYAYGDNTKNKSDRKEPIKKNDQFIEVANAGLVLLWPYLNKFFKHLQLLKDEAFVSNKAAHKAVHLLHFIGTGAEEGSEYQWPLNKLLCGLRPDTFVSEEIELTSEEKQEARSMMEAAIGHWEALKNTSFSGFRETFLLRDGIIKPDPRGWKVQVERETYDILLDRLPWPISIIILPWNKFMIYVEW